MGKLLLAGFHAQSLLTLEEIERILQEMPVSHRNSVQVVRYDPTRSIMQLMAMAGDHYSPPGTMAQHIDFGDRQGVVIYPFRSRKEFKHALFHEFGHAVFLRVLTQEQRDVWFYQIRKEEPGSVTQYGNTNAREDFAESYAVYLTRDPRIQQKPLRKAFFARNVFPDDSAGQK